jgi:hypothetical protein
MRVPLIPPRPTKRRPEPPAESFALKTVFVASALLLCAMVMVEMEFYISAPAHSLSEVEVAVASR